MKAPLSVALGLLVISCHPSDNLTVTAETTGRPSKENIGAPVIAASPNPATGSGTLEETTITWDTGTGQPGEVYVSKNRGEEKRFGAGPSGSKKAAWIAAHTRYQFRLYQGKEHKKILAEVEVTHKA